MGKKDKYITLRLDADLLKQLKQQASDDRRSLNEYIYLILLDESSKRWANKQPIPQLEKAVFKL